MFGIIVALKSECKYLLESLSDKKQIKLADKEAYLCSISGKDCIIAISGIGKVSAGITAQMIIDKYSPDFILNFGTCGGMNDSVKILNYYAIEKCCQFDFDVTELDDVPLGYIQEYDCVYFPTQTKGLEFLEKSSVASADRFTNDIKDITAVNQIDCSLRDMEAGAIGQACKSNAVSLYIIKGISDVYGSQTAQEQFFKNLSTVAEGFAKIIPQAVESIYKAISK